jgi:hypothetical protein
MGQANRPVCICGTAYRDECLDLLATTREKVLHAAEAASESALHGVAEFWEVARTWEPCECGNCKLCGAEWAIAWSIAAESNPDLIQHLKGLRERGRNGFGAHLGGDA